MSWTCTCATQNLDAARYCEFCGVEHTPTAAPARRRDTQWSPPVPAFRDEPWRRARPMPPVEAKPFLEELRGLKAKLGVPAEPVTLDPAMTARYLAACVGRPIPPREPVSGEVGR